ncbi:hypothetical protein [Laspinema olomoucense]|uniref:Uncharacterized protein n=1 Tax=Laspinema olomoucense D3b TaxID=2953688 RepID=A0ABT2NAL9_9CYAN|nr:MULTISPECIES: hypothetical protein [unclassified Laspinema]MCT7971846.1 hypothetical protein [Laspinema sp. D3d]MCT7979748.1 hypothetical protein [Laspinema sp. D3b]MCT7991791.1 hypothetical protein [Laspinema sp. D3a]
MVQYSSNKKLPLLNKIPEPLKSLINKIREERYTALYESEADGTASLDNALNDILDVFQTSGKTLCHFRYVWLSLILVLVVEPIVESYQAQNNFTKSTLELLERGIYSQIDSDLSSKKLHFDLQQEIDNLEAIFSQPIEPIKNKGIANLQIISESRKVFRNALRVLDREQAKEATLEILKDCLEGYAIFPGSSGRRDLFDWWLLEVVPASWYLLSPRTLYVGEWVENPEEFQVEGIKKLQEISSQVRSIFTKNSST